MYIAIVNGEPSGHPITAENLMYLVEGLVEIPPENLFQLGYAEFKPDLLKPVCKENEVLMESGLTMVGLTATRTWSTRPFTEVEIQQAKEEEMMKRLFETKVEILP